MPHPKPGRSLCARIEQLENRTLFAAGNLTSLFAHPGIDETVGQKVSLHPDVSRQTTTKLQVSRHVGIIGQPLIVRVTVKSARGAASPAGTIQLVDDGTNLPNTLTLTPGGRASYAFQVGNVAFFPGVQTLAAVYTSSNSLFGSVSNVIVLDIKLPKYKPTADGFVELTLHKGQGKQTVKAGQTIRVSYTGFLQPSGEVFDYATADHGAGSTPYLQFTVQASPQQVIPGFDRGVLGMKVGEIRALLIPSNLGYGANGNGNLIPPDADLLFLVKLLSISKE